jgi:hypothetical protein
MDLKREDGRTAQTWTCSGGNPQQVSLWLFSGERRDSQTDHNNSPVFALGLGVGVHHWTPSLPLNLAGTSLKRWRIGLGVRTDEQIENRTVIEFGIGVGIGMDNQTKRSERDYMDNQIKRYAREYGQSDTLSKENGQ